MNGHAGNYTLEATEHLKNILNVGKSETETEKTKTVSNGNMEAAGDANLVLDNRSYQKIELSADKDSSDHSVYGNEVDIYSSPIVFGASCSQIIVNHMVDFGWEEKYYNGRLITCHLSGKYLAYVLKPSNNKPGYVRVLKLRSDWRYLIKDYKHEVKDIAFAHCRSQALLGSVDACGEFLVHKVSENDTALLCDLLLHILRPDSWVPSEHNHIIWCLYIPDDNEDESTKLEKTSLLVVTHEEKAEIWDIQNVIQTHGHGALTIEEVTAGVQSVTEFEKPITTATFSPDGSALAIGSLDGVVKFFQVNIIDKNNSPRCLHHWTPHGDKTLSSLYFLDNHKDFTSDIQFWKFAVTGADNNTELKVWCCETWVCLQTIRIHANPEDLIELQPCLKAEMDLTSNYLILSDIKRKVLLILLVQQEPVSNSAFIKSVSEFRVALPVLNLAIISVSFLKLSTSGGENSDDEEVEQIGDAVADNDDNRNKLIVNLYWIQTKTLQSCRITYKPKLESPLHSIGSVSSLSQESYGFKDGLSDISLDAKESSSRTTRDLEMSLQKGLCIDKLAVSSQSSSSNLNALASHLNFSSCTEVLLTPDDFTSPSHGNLSAQNAYKHHEEAKDSITKCESATRLSDGIDSLPVEPSTLTRRKSSQHSATSSPSREVAEIMAPTKGLNLDQIVLETPNIKVKDDVEALSNTIGNFTVSPTPISSRKKLDYHLKEWPEAPDPSKEYRVSNRSEKDLKNNHTKCFLTTTENTSTVSYDAESNRILYQLNQKLDKMLNQIEELKESSSSQRLEIQSLQSEVKTLQDQKQSQMNTNLSGKLDQVVAQHLVPGYSRIENLILKSSDEEKRRAERELAVISTDLSASFGSRLDSIVKQELAGCILPQINRVLDSVAQKMQLDFTQRIGATDASVKETFNKHLKGKAFIDSLAQSISLSLQDIIHSTCKELFQSSVVPALEKSCQNLFHQLNELFQKGTLDYIQILEKNGITSSAMLENTSTQLKEEIRNLAISTQQAINNNLAQVENRNLELMKQRETMFSSMRQIIFEEVRKALKSQASVLNSRSVTPVPHNDIMLQKQQLIQLAKQSINDAFQQALSAMDVQLVIFLCESLNVEQVFGTTPCPLQQHVLLSLVNQLSTDLSVKTEIKVRYIEEVIACLDSSDRIIKEHSRKVLEDLQQKITNFQQVYPSHKLNRNLKRIFLAVQSLMIA